MSILETNSKINKPILYNKVIADSVYRTYFYQAIDKKLYNLSQHNIWIYKKLLEDWKTIK